MSPKENNIEKPVEIIEQRFEYDLQNIIKSS